MRNNIQNCDEIIEKIIRDKENTKIKRSKCFNFSNYSLTDIIYFSTKYAMLIITGLSIIYAIFMFGNEVKKKIYNENSNDFSIEITRKLDSIIKIELERENSELLSLAEQKELSKIINKSSKEIIELVNNENEINSLTVIEHIFIYFLPLLVLLGLYYYFEANFMTKLLGSEKSSPDSNEITQAKDRLNLTKQLFISSIMSYVIIKFIEKTMLSEKIPDIKVIISGAFLLILLSAYLLLSHKYDSKHNN